MGIFPSDSSSTEITNTIAISSTDLPIFKQRAWDYKTDQYIIKDGNFVILEGNEALKIWIYKALKTAKYRYAAYSHNYGNTIDTLIGKSISEDIRTMQIKVLVEECLLVNPYIKSIDNIEADGDSDVLTGTVSITTVYGSMEVDM